MSNFISGFVAGTVSSLICFPLQVIQLQQQISRDNLSIKRTIKNIYNKQGIKGYYYGVSKSILSYSIFYGIYFYSYNLLKESFNTKYNNCFINSYIASGIGSIISNPWHVVRVRRQTCILSGELNLNPTIRNIYNEEGIKSLFKGVKLTMFKNIELSLIMSINEYLTNNYEMPIVYSSFIGKITAATITYPIDSARNLVRYGKIIKNKKYRESLSLKEVLIKFNKNPSSMYNGYPIYLIKSIPSCVIAFSINELIK